MPGLLRGVARTAVISGTATAVSNNVSRRQAERWQRQEVAEGAPQQYEQAPAAVAAPPQAADPIEQLERLGQLKAQGLLTDEEFASQKAKLLG